MTISPETYRRFIDSLLSGDRAAAREITIELLQAEISVRDLYLDLFQRSMYEVGSLWEQNRISVAVEHMATSIVESLLPLVYPKIFGAEHTGKRAVISCVANEFHQIGGKMVADIFELNGWDGYFTGANTPLPDLKAMIADKKPDLLGLSVSNAATIAKLHAIVEDIRSEFPALHVLLGGQAFLWGGTEIIERYEGLIYLPSITELEGFLAEYGAHEAETGIG